MGAGAKANLVCRHYLRRHNELLVNRSFPAVTTYPAQATLKFGNGRTGEVCHAVDITVGAAGIKGRSTAFVSDSDIPALRSTGALETLQGCLDFARHALTLGANGKVIFLQVSEVGRYILSFAHFPQARSDMHSLPTFAACVALGSEKSGDAHDGSYEKWRIALG